MFTLNVPNALTVLRILLVPVLVVALLDETSSPWLAAAVFAAASLTDAIDGYIARARKQITTFGKLMDPVADKLLIIAALVVARLARPGPGVDRDGDHRPRVRGDRHAAGGDRPGRRDLGELVGQGQDDGAGRGDLLRDRLRLRPRSACDVLLYGAVAITVVSGIDYFFGLRRMLREADERRQRVEPLAHRRVMRGVLA